MFYYIYLLKSSSDKSWYIGYTSNLIKRFESHNKGLNVATKNKRPWELIYYEAYKNRLDAKKREVFLKSGSGRKFLKKQLTTYLSNI
jgi:putative endonuclease